MMAFSTEPSEQPRKKYTRAKAPKARTGCITCKIRHLKCDETKPTCRRCAKDGHKCDGYQDARAPRRTRRLKPKKQNEASNTQHIFVPGLAFERQGALVPALSIINHASYTDAALFYHARKLTLEDFDMTSCLGFWRRFVVPLAYTSEPVKYALCALGAAHCRFVTGYPGGSLPSSLGVEFEIASIRKYNQAISYIKPLLSNNTESNVQITLVCCVIFICIENLHGRYKDSIRHLHAGCQLLNSICGTSGLTRRHLTRFYVKEKEETEYNLFEMVTEMLYRLGQNVAAYEGNDSFSDLHLQPRIIDMGNPETPFASLIEADLQLDLVDDIYGTSIDDYQSVNQLAGRSSINTPRLCPDPQTRRLALRKARLAFTAWNSRYELTKKDQRYERPSPEERHGLAFLNMHQAIWSATVRLDHIDDDFLREDCELILQKISILIDIEADRIAPVFAFNGYLIPALSIVCSSCTDTDIQWRSISLLRALRRREGIWDSQEAASVYEMMVAAGVQNMVDRDSLPSGIPQLVAKLSALPLAGGGFKTAQPSQLHS